MALKLVRMARGSPERERHNRRAYGVFVRAQGVEKGRARFKDAQTFLAHPEFSGSGWYANPKLAQRFFIQTPEGKTVGIAGLFLSAWVIKERDRIIVGSREEAENYARQTDSRRQRLEQWADSKDPAVIKKREQLEKSTVRRRLVGSLQRGINQSQILPPGIVALPEIGIYIDKQYQHKGFGAEAIKQACRILKSKGYQFAYMNTAASNTAMIKAAQKIGNCEVIPQSKPGKDSQGNPEERVYIVKKL